MHTFTALFIAAVILSVTLQLWLSARQSRFVGQHREQVPDDFSQSISLDEHKKAADYTLAQLKLGKRELGYETLLLLLWTLGGGLSLLDHGIGTLGWSEITTGVAFLIGFSLIGGLLALPFSLYRTFRLEARFGFNRTTMQTFVTDIIKNTLLSLIIGVPFIYLVLWMMDSMGSLWWLYVWMAYMGLSLTMFWLYPSVIAPLFNKFSPLADETLKARIEALLSRCGFTSQGIFIMDGSRRSAHGNAYFTGMGKNKRIVFFDTLTNSLDHDEVEAVLAHELGHFRRKHISKRMLLMALTTLLGLAVLGWLIQAPWFYTALGAEQVSNHMALVLFMLISPVFTFLFTPVFSAYSRKHEFEADEFAAHNSDANKLITALVKMYQENASTLTPDPIYSAFYHSHPPAPIRIQHLRTVGATEA
ncbi:MAG: M48 family metallopeptidase [Gammaproteobacteria bacterium]|nr:M48 family metallopeptidase [Gammaproteobacteria bacterium]